MCRFWICAVKRNSDYYILRYTAKWVNTTRDQNEDIHLWLLEQYRINNQKRVRLETERKKADHSSILADLDFGDLTIPEVENKQAELHMIIDFEKLTKEKAALEEMSACLDEKQRALDLQARILCTKLVAEIRKRNNKKLQTVSQLREKIKTLENQLSFVNKIPELKKENDAKRQETSKLREMVDSLETQLQELSASHPQLGKHKKEHRPNRNLSN